MKIDPPKRPSERDLRTMRSAIETIVSPGDSGKGVADDPISPPPGVRLQHLMRRPFDVRSFALTGLFVLAIFYTMYFMRSILLPLVLALLLSYLIRPIVRAFARTRIPPPLTAAAILLSLVAIVGYALSFLATDAAGWLEKAPYSLHQLQSKLLPLQQPLEKVSKASGEIEKLATPAGAGTEPAVVEVKTHPIADLLYGRAPEFIVSAVLSIILLYFLLAHDGVFLTKLVKLLPTLADKKRAVSIANEIEAHVSRYLLTITLINTGLGIAVGTAAGLFGLPNPLMWGAMVAVLNFVPYIGALTGIVCMTLGALLSFDNVGYALLFPATYLTFAALEGNFITPWVMGRSLTLNPVIVLLSLIFWGWMWGIAGIILAVPILAAFKIFCAHIKPIEPIAEFLS
jgi:predicted PurR-regulated permease PerM